MSAIDFDRSAALSQGYVLDIQAGASKAATCTAGTDIRGSLRAQQVSDWGKVPDRVSCERKGSAMLFFQSSSSLKCCSFTAGEVSVSCRGVRLQLSVLLSNNDNWASGT